MHLFHFILYFLLIHSFLSNFTSMVGLCAVKHIYKKIEMKIGEKG